MICIFMVEWQLKDYIKIGKNKSLRNALCKKKIFVVTISISIVLCSCISEIDRETLIYDNNFETVNLTKIVGAFDVVIHNFFKSFVWNIFN